MKLKRILSLSMTSLMLLSLTTQTVLAVDEAERNVDACSYGCWYNLGPGVVTGSSVYCRKGPGTSYGIVGTYNTSPNSAGKYRTSVSVKGGTTLENSSWSHVHGTYIGFVHNDYVSVTEPASITDPEPSREPTATAEEVSVIITEYS